MAERIVLNAEILRELLEYKKDTGKLYWKKRDVKWFASQRSCNSFNARDSGTEAFTADGGHGYLMGIVLGNSMLAHRVAWAIHYGEIPSLDIDHKNCNKKDNRIENLRLATGSQNASNKHMYKNNTSGYKGVTWYERNGKWASKIRINGKLLHLGYFSEKEDAYAAYCMAAPKHHGEFARIK